MAGIGAIKPVSGRMIKKVKDKTHVPLIIGGGINSLEKAISACKAGADIIVIGNAIEKSPQLIRSISKAIHKF